MRASLALVILATTLAAAADWPQWRGPHRDAVSRETGLLREWPAAGPERVWTSKVAGRGFGGPAVVGERIYILAPSGRMSSSTSSRSTRPAGNSGCADRQGVRLPRQRLVARPQQHTERGRAFHLRPRQPGRVRVC